MTSGNQNPPSGEQQAASQSSETQTQIRDTTTELNPPPTHSKCKHACKEEKHWLDYVTFGLEFIGLVVLCVYAAYTIKIYSANSRAADAAHDTLGQIQEQTKVLRQQLVGTQAAVIDISTPVWDPTKRTLSITLASVNPGSVAGMINSFRADLQRKTWPEEKPIGEPLPIILPTPNITVLKSGQFAIEKGLPWPLPPKLNDQRFWPGKEIVRLEGIYTYSNGFGDSYAIKFCYLWVPPWDLTMPVPNQGGWSGGQWSGGKQGCPAVQEKIGEFMGIQKHIKDASTPQH